MTLATSCDEIHASVQLIQIDINREVSEN